MAHMLAVAVPLEPCRLCGSTRPPLVGAVLGQRRIVRCLDCGNLLIADADLADPEIAELWNARARRRGSGPR